MAATNIMDERIAVVDAALSAITGTIRRMMANEAVKALVTARILDFVIFIDATLFSEYG